MGNVYATTKRVREFSCQNEKPPCKWFNMEPLRIGIEVTSDPPKRNSTLLILKLKQISTRKMQGIKFKFEKILLKTIIIFHLFT
jgi:hypothetical protein